MLENVQGRSITSAEKTETGVTLTLDNGTRFQFNGTSDCCARSQVDQFVLNENMASNVITHVERVKTNEDRFEGDPIRRERWFFLADMDETLSQDNKVATMDVTANEGNACYFFAFEIEVERLAD